MRITREACSRAATTVVVVTYNHTAQIERCLDAVLKTTPVGTEVIVVDNASIDGTASLVNRRFPAVRLLHAPSNLGYGAANNLAARHACGDIFVFLNPDTEPQAGWLTELVEVVKDAPDNVLATPKLLLSASPDRIDTVGNDVHVSGITPSRGWNEPAARYSGTEEVSAVSGACFAISRQLYERLGGFCERLFLYYEDTELSLRARLAGAQCVAVGGAQVLHDHTPGFTPAKLRHLERNRWWTLLTIYRWRTLVALLPVLLLAEVMAWAMAVMSGPAHGAAKAHAWVDVLRWLPRLRAARARTQKLRRVSDASLLRLHGSRIRLAQVRSGPLAMLVENVAAGLFGGGRSLARLIGAT